MIRGRDKKYVVAVDKKEGERGKCLFLLLFKFYEPVSVKLKRSCLETEFILKIALQLCNGNSYLIHGITVTDGYCEIFL